MHSDRYQAGESVIDVPGRDGPERSLVASGYRFGCWLVIEPAGEVDLAGVPLLRRLLDWDCSHVVFDLGRVTFIDAYGLGFLAQKHHQVSRAHGAVRVARPSPQTLRLLTLTALDQHLEVFESLGEAFAGHGSCW